RVVAPTVILYPQDAEWDCDCESRLAACEHVAAAVIALKRAREGGQALPSAGSSDARIVYRFKQDRGKLNLSRAVARADGSERAIEGSLAGLASKMGGQFMITPSQDDLAIDRALTALGSNVPTFEVLTSLLKWLSSATHVELDGKVVRTSAETVSPRVVVEDEGSGFRVIIEANPRIDEIVAPGIARLGDQLHPLAHVDLTGPRLEKLPNTKQYTKAQLPTLVTEVLPALHARFEVDVRSKKLPKVDRAIAPRVVLDVEQVEHSLSVLATLVYGDPPVARVDSGQLIHLGGNIPVRDEEAERGLQLRLRDQLNLNLGSRLQLNGDAAAHFAAGLEQWKGEIRGSAAGKLVHSSALTPQLRSDGKTFDLRFSARDNPALQADAQAVVRAWREGQSLVPLLSGGWAKLPLAWLEEHGQRILDLLAAREPNQTLRGYAKPWLAELCEKLNVPVPMDLRQLATKLHDFTTLPQAPLPGDLTATLRDYQQQGVNWLHFLRQAGLGATLADDMGLGKTLQTLCAIQGKTLIVCPTSVVHNWAAEIERFRPQLRFNKYHGPKRKLDESEVTLTSYAVMRLDLATLNSIEWDTVVLDEAQTIKNPESQVTQAAYELSGAFRITLSGTPVENRLEELWSQFHFTNRGLLGTRDEFQERYTAPMAVGKAGVAAQLRDKIRPFLLRRLKEDVAKELPPRTDVVLHCELGDDERTLYDAIFASTQTDVVQNLRAGGSVMQALESLLRLRQACCHPALVPGQAAESSSKLRRLLAALELVAADGHKALVFSQWTSLLDLAEPHLTQARIAFTRLDGSTRDRQAVVNQFQAADGPPVMLLSLKAGGTGLNLTSADHVFLLDLWWNPAVEEQAADRAHRIGQERPVMVYRLVAKDTVEERILALQEQKREIAEAALSGADKAGSLTREDLLALLQP
ncbi:MAG TPA: DEAD/DEAH box helicase, partial [Polyangiaceae bacterium]|nr:DEAD/DEAH box helicase [Polyangiaceae bacterium]